MITEQKLDILREKIQGSMSPKRFFHTAEVEKTAAYLGSLYAPDKILELRAVALLHDTTKERVPEWHIMTCARHGIELSRDALLAAKTLHAVTAAALIPEDFSEFATDEIIGCVRWHTTGKEGMTLLEKIIYLADYIDMSRTFEDCVKLREYFMSAHPEKMDMEKRLYHLDDTLIMSFDMTVRGLIEDGKLISRDTVSARNSLIRERLVRFEK